MNKLLLTITMQPDRQGSLRAAGKASGKRLLCDGTPKKPV
jgi:hypothetical protein